MRLFNRFLVVCICSVAITTIVPQSLKAEQIETCSIIDQVDNLFLPDKLNKPLASLSTLTTEIALALPILPIYRPLFSTTTMEKNPLLTSLYQTALYAGSVGLVYISTELLKNGFSRSRPFSDVSEDPHKSFPSRHTALSFAAAAFQSVYLKNSGKSIEMAFPIDVSNWSLAILTGYLRIVSGEHFMSDVLAGAIIGSLIGIAGGIVASL